MTKKSPKTLAIDIGGTGLKMLVLDESGKAITERTRVPTPRPATPEAVLGGLTSMTDSHGKYDRISVGFPGVVSEGIVRTAPNLDGDWNGFNLGKSLADHTGKPVRCANDADVQGLGMIEGEGVEIMITLGTGLGSALFVNGRLVPNLELGHHPFRKGKTYEQFLGKAALAERGKKKWAKSVLQAIAQISHTFNYDVLYLGGGNAKKLVKMEVELPHNVRITENIAGLLGGIALWRH